MAAVYCHICEEHGHNGHSDGAMRVQWENGIPQPDITQVTHPH